jgi:hypothetical protein
MTMLLPLLVALLLFAGAMWAIARTARWIMTRLHADPMATLLWLGLAEWPIEQPRSQRQRLKHLILDAPPPSTG